MVTEKERDELYRPYDTLKAIGFTKDEAKGFLTNIENAITTQSPTAPKTAPPEIAVKFRAQRSELRRSRFKSLLLIVWGYAFALWLYVIALQFFYPESIYWPFATWLPVRLDYVGEAAFVSSFFIATAVTMWNTKRSLRPRHQELGPNRANSA